MPGRRIMVRLRRVVTDALGKKLLNTEADRAAATGRVPTAAATTSRRRNGASKNDQAWG
jgi:hypothetical protein